MGWLKGLIGLCCRCYVPMFRIKLTGSVTFHWPFTHIVQQSTPPLGCPLLSSCMVVLPRSHPSQLPLPMTHRRTNPSYTQNWLSYMTLWRQILQRQHTYRGVQMSTGHRHDSSVLVIQYGCSFPLQVNWTLTGRENGGYMLFQNQ